MKSTLTDPKAAGFHVSGMIELIRIAGPQAFQHQPFLNVLEAARATIVVTSLIIRRRTFFAEPAWAIEPWALDPSQKTPQSLLLDILAPVPGVLEDCDTMSQLRLPDEISALRISIKNRLVSLLSELFCWRWRWQARNSHQVCSAVGSDQASTGGRPGPLSFRTAGAAADVMQYNALLAWLLALLWDVEPVLTESDVEDCAGAAMETVLAEQEVGLLEVCREPLSHITSFEPLQRPGGSASLRDAAVEICRIYEWQALSQSHGETREANLLYMWPLGVAMCVLDSDAGSRGWIAGLLKLDPLTRDYGGFSMAPENATSESSVGAGASHVAGGPLKRMSDAERVKNFGSILLREIATKDDLGSTGRIPNPGLIHLLLLRGRFREE